MNDATARAPARTATYPSQYMLRRFLCRRSQFFLWHWRRKELFCVFRSPVSFILTVRFALELGVERLNCSFTNVEIFGFE